jgi:hypothetical protein
MVARFSFTTRKSGTASEAARPTARMAGAISLQTCAAMVSASRSTAPPAAETVTLVWSSRTSAHWASDPMRPMKRGRSGPATR